MKTSKNNFRNWQTIFGGALFAALLLVLMVNSIGTHLSKIKSMPIASNSINLRIKPYTVGGSVENPWYESGYAIGGVDKNDNPILTVQFLNISSRIVNLTYDHADNGLTRQIDIKVYNSKGDAVPLTEYGASLYDSGLIFGFIKPLGHLSEYSIIRIPSRGYRWLRIGLGRMYKLRPIEVYTVKLYYTPDQYSGLVGSVESNTIKIMAP